MFDYETDEWIVAIPGFLSSGETQEANFCRVRAETTILHFGLELTEGIVTFYV